VHDVLEERNGTLLQKGRKDGSIGMPIPGVVTRIVDPDSGRNLSAGMEGLLMVKGPNVMVEYLGDPEKTAEVLRDGWYNTGDMAKLDEDGFVYIVDRLSRYSKIGGEMVPHLAVEDALLASLQTVDSCLAVTSAPDERKGEQLIVFYTDEAGQPERLHAAIQESELPNLWRPRKENYFRLDQLPKLGSGKLDLKQLRELALKLTTGEKAT
jgi:acyl-[acyl-carrier-protein]-phospholipid O-acyltransferase/long-chain-fatty-acid--[acyl-carrier-protein] ligase